MISIFGKSYEISYENMLKSFLLTNEIEFVKIFFQIVRRICENLDPNLILGRICEIGKRIHLVKSYCFHTENYCRLFPLTVIVPWGNVSVPWWVSMLFGRIFTPAFAWTIFFDTIQALWRGQQLLSASFSRFFEVQTINGSFFFWIFTPSGPCPTAS